MAQESVLRHCRSWAGYLLPRPTLLLPSSRSLEVLQATAAIGKLPASTTA
jgi:hypothetical protein